MKLFCEGLDLSDAVLKVIKAASNKSTNPILEGIKLTAEDNLLTLVATDGELAIEKKIKADVKVEGEVVVPGKLFSEFVKKLSNEQIELSLNENNQMRIKYTDSQVYIQCLNAKEFPNIQKIDNSQFFGIKQNDFKDIIEKTIFSVALDDTRPILKGCLFVVEDNKLTSVALDGYRLALAIKPIKEASSRITMIVPGRSLNEISKLLNDTEDDIRVFVQQNFLMVQIDNTKIITRLLGNENDFIKYKQIIPAEYKTTLAVNKAQLEDSLERVAILARASNDNAVKLNIRENVMTLTCNSDLGNVTENITVALTGNDLQIAFDNFFLRECLKSVKDEYVKIQLNGSINPCVIVPNEGNDYLFLILPMKSN